MTDERTLEEKLETRLIPRFDIPSSKSRDDFHGQPTVVRRVTCERSAVSMHRLALLLGPVLMKYFSWSDEHAPTEDENKKTLADIMGFKVSSDFLKSKGLLEALPELKERLTNIRTDELWFHVRNLLLGHLDVGGITIKTEKDLDATGIDLVALMPLMFDAMEVNYFSSFADRSTPSGSESRSADKPNEEPTESPASPSPQAPTRSSGNEGTRRAGRSGRTRKS